jgi:hypothetical protein
MTNLTCTGTVTVLSVDPDVVPVSMTLDKTSGTVPLTVTTTLQYKNNTSNTISNAKGVLWVGNTPISFAIGTVLPNGTINVQQSASLTTAGTYNIRPEVPYGFPLVYGDVIGDGVVNLNDSVYLTNYIAGTPGYTLDLLQLKAADVTGDGIVDAADAGAIANCVMHVPNTCQKTGQSLGLVYGDINFDGKVDNSDVTLLGNLVNGTPAPTANQFAAGDINKSGTLNIGDITLLGNYIISPTNPSYNNGIVGRNIVTLAPQSVTVTAPVVLGSITLTTAYTTIHVGDSDGINASCYDTTGATLTCPSLVWTVSPAGAGTFATIGSGVVFTAGSTGGTVTITASDTVTGKSGSVQITITLPPVLTTIIVTPSNPMIAAGNTVQLTATCDDQNGNTMTCPTLTWYSQGTNIATVDQNGLVTGVVAGSITVVAVSDTKIQGTTTVTVQSPLPMFPAPGSETVINVPGHYQGYYMSFCSWLGNNQTIPPGWTVTSCSNAGMGTHGGCAYCNMILVDFIYTG